MLSKLLQPQATSLRSQALAFQLPYLGDLLRLTHFDERARGEKATADAGIGVGYGTRAHQHPRVEHGVAACLAAVTEDRSEFAQTSVIGLATSRKADLATNVFDIRADRTGTEIDVAAEDGVTDIGLMRRLRALQQY